MILVYQEHFLLQKIKSKLKEEIHSNWSFNLCHLNLELSNVK
jgi:hypothetical protein